MGTHCLCNRILETAEHGDLERRASFLEILSPYGSSLTPLRGFHCQPQCPQVTQKNPSEVVKSSELLLGPDPT